MLPTSSSVNSAFRRTLHLVRMDPIVMTYVYLGLQSKKGRKRRWKVHPINRARYVDGAFRNIYGLLREDSDKFYNYFRMSVTSFDELVVKVRQSKSTRPEILSGLESSIEEMMCVTLRYLASGCSYMDLHYMYRIGTATISLIVPSMCRLLWISLENEVFPNFNENFWRQTAEGFKQRAYFPHCIGAVDCKHIRIIKPEHSGSLYYNYKSYFSVVLLAIADSNYKLIYVDVGSMGKDADPTIFDCSSFGMALRDGKLNIPVPERISSNTGLLPYVLVGDEAFGIHVNLMRPFPGRNLTRETRIFNYRLSSARRFVECTFGLLANKWRISHRPLNLKLCNVQSVLKATCVLHNYVRERDGYRFQDTLEVTGLHDIEHEDSQRLSRGTKTAYVCRNDFVTYFNSPEGRVPWQDDKV